MLFVPKYTKVNNVTRLFIKAEFSGRDWQPSCIVKTLWKSKLIADSLLNVITLKTTYPQKNYINLIQIEAEL